jgi:hypothetical protein
MLLDSLDVWHHHCKRLAHAPLAAAQFGHSFIIRRVARQVKSPNAFHGDNLALSQPLPRLFNRLSSLI